MTPPTPPTSSAPPTLKPEQQELLQQHLQQKLTLSYSQITCWMHCRLRWYWIYCEGLVPRKSSPPLIIGSITHQLLDAYYSQQAIPNQVDLQNLLQQLQEQYPDEPQEELQQHLIQSATLLNGYLQTFQQDNLQVTSPELWLHLDLGEFNLRARLDALCRDPSNNLWRMEHKTSTRTDSAFLKGLRSGLQTAICYWLMEELLTEPVRGSVFNILIKKKQPEFPRQAVPKDAQALRRAKQTVWGVYRQITQGDIFPSSDCFTYNRECSYLPLCQQDTPSTRRTFFRQREEVIRHERLILNPFNGEWKA